MQDELDSLFTDGELEPALLYFSNRVDELEALSRSVQVHSELLKKIVSNTKPPWKVEPNRRNILHFYGIGGVGKSTLLQALVAWLRDSRQHLPDWPPRNGQAPAITLVQYDLGELPRRSAEGVLLEVRAQLAETGQKAPCFDLLLLQHWATVYPGEDLTEFLATRTWAREYARSVGLKAQIEDSLTEWAAELGAGGSVGGGLVRHVLALASRLRSELGRRKRLNQHPWLLPLLERASRAGTFPYFAAALAVDIRESQRDTGDVWIVVCDHYEGASEDLDAALRRIVWLMPNVLFVTAGRKRLRWAEAPAGSVSGLRGLDRWPLLAANATSEPRQHRIGNLSDEDATEYVHRAFANMEMSEEIVEAIVVVAAGHPLHLDLLRKRCLQIWPTRNIVVEDVSLPFPELVAAVTRDLDQEERGVLFSAALFDAFDLKLIREAAGVPRFATILGLVQRPGLEETDSQAYPYRLHAELRDILLRAPVSLDTGWSTDDWRLAGKRALNAISSRLSDSRTEELNDRRFLIMQFLRLARTFSRSPESLVPYVTETTAISDWSPDWDSRKLPLSLADTLAEREPWLEDFCDGVQVVMTRQNRPREEVFHALSDIIERSGARTELDVVRLFASEAARDAARLGMAREYLTPLLQREGPLKARAVHGLVHITKRLGDFAAAQDLVRSNRSILPAPDRLDGDLLWPHGRLNEARRSYERGFEAAKKAGDPGEAALCAALQAWVEAIGVPEAAPASIRRMKTAAGQGYYSFAETLAGAAQCVSDASLDPKFDVASQMTLHSERSAGLGHSSIHAYCKFGELLVHLKREDRRSARWTYRGLVRLCRGQLPYLLVISRWLFDTRVFDHSIVWLDDEPRRRWQAVLGRTSNG